MATVRGQVRRVEDFDIAILHHNGRKVRDDRVTRFAYSSRYNHAMPGSATVSDWRTHRFDSHFPDFKVNVLDAQGRRTHGSTQLSTVRRSYAEAGAIRDGRLSAAPLTPDLRQRLAGVQMTYRLADRHVDLDSRAVHADVRRGWVTFSGERDEMWARVEIARAV